MSVRRGHWVNEHYRNGVLVAGHFRSGSVVADGGGGWEPPSPHRSQISSPAQFPPLHHGDHKPGLSLTFLTQCYWCNDDVFFHRNKNGGCVLFDSLGPPWPVHPCWEQYCEDRAEAIDTALRNHAAYLRALEDLREEDAIRETNKAVTRLTGPQECITEISTTLELDGVIIADDRVAYIRLLNNPRDSLITGILLEANDGSIYRILVDAKVRKKLRPHIFIRATCSTGVRGKNKIIFADKIVIYDPNENATAVCAYLTIDDVISSRWASTQGKSWRGSEK